MQMEARPKTATVLHVIFAMLTAFLAAYTYKAYSKWAFYSTLADKGVDAVGTVVDKVPPDTVVVRYSDPTGRKIHLGRAGLTPELFARIEPGDTLRIRYLASVPERPEVVPYIEPTRKLARTTLALAMGLLVVGALIPWALLSQFVLGNEEQGKPTRPAR